MIGRDGHETVLAVDPEPHNVDFGPNEQWDTSVLRLTHQSLTTPARVLDVDITTGDIDVVKQTPTPNVDLDAYVAERNAISIDGLAAVDAAAPVEPA